MSPPPTPVKVLAAVRDLDTGEYFLDIKIQLVDSGSRRVLLPRSTLTSATSAKHELLKLGAVLPTARGSGSLLLAHLSATPKKSYEVTGKTGWHNNSFVLPDQTLGPTAHRLFYRQSKFNQGGESARPRIGGTREAWREQLREPCLASSYLTFSIAVAFAGPLIVLVGQDEGATFYLAGETTTGKTLSELAGQSVIERATREGLLTHDATKRSIEEHCAEHNDLMLVIDDLSRKEGSQAEIRNHIREWTHKIAGGGGTRRSAKARQDIDLANKDWRLLSLWSGEIGLTTEFLGRQRSGGEIVRLTEIRVPRPKAQGIWDRLTDSQSSATLVRGAETAIRNNFGHPIRAFLGHLTRDPDKYAKRTKRLMDKFLRKIGVSASPRAMRLATKFALVYAGGELAAELGIAPWPRKHVFKCVARLYRKASRAIATPDEAADALLMRLAGNASSSKRFLKLSKGAAVPKTTAREVWGLRRTRPDGVAYLAIHSDRFDRLVRPRSQARNVRQLLIKRGCMIKGKEGRGVRQIKVRGLGSAKKPYFVCIRLDRLPKCD